MNRSASSNLSLCQCLTSVVALALGLGLAGCLKTRNDSKENETRNVIEQRIQKANADSTSKFSELEDQMREFNGRLEVVEAKSGQNSGDTMTFRQQIAGQNQDSAQKMQLLQEALTQLETKITQMSNDLEELKSAKSKSSSSSKSSDKGNSKPSSSQSFTQAENHFAQRDWRKAILSYKEYRDENPKGKSYPEATYKIGVCFQELGMDSEAQVFFDEVVSRFPNGGEAKRAKVRLKALKK